MVALVLLLSAVACDDSPPPVSGASVDKEGNVKKPKAAPKPKKEKPAELEAEEEGLTDADFIEGPTNRDPFRSFINQFSRDKKQAQERQRPVLAKRYALDKIKLTAIVTGRATQPKAMFVDPKGLGVTVERGDYISKSEARVKQIFKDKILLEIEEVTDDKRRKQERVIELHKKDPNEATD